ncbi:MAG: selenide, water dikinase SelD [Acidobacteria bacterium]|nr:selenide, water dikinase SelD [Acidobacteriota bacterium]
MGGIASDAAVLVGPGTADDAGVYRLGDEAIVATADFITPMCDDPHRFGRVAAANALSDVYAMGGSALFALNLCCFPEDAAPAGTMEAILAGGMEKLREAGAALLGGHSVRDAELKYGLAVVGRAAPDRLLTNAGARAGEDLVLTKPLGTGALINGFRGGEVDEIGLEPALAGMERLNDAAGRLALEHGANGATDVTGYGLAGHGLEIARASEVSLHIHVDTLPVYPGFDDVHAAGVATRGERENAAAAGGAVEFGDAVSDRGRQLLFDPQTSGGLLIAVAANRSEALLSALRHEDYVAARIGTVETGEPAIVVD